MENHTKRARSDSADMSGQGSSTNSVPSGHATLAGFSPNKKQRQELISSWFRKPGGGTQNIDDPHVVKEISESRDAGNLINPVDLSSGNNSSDHDSSRLDSNALSNVMHPLTETPGENF